RRRIPPLVPALGALVLATVWLAPYPKTSAAFHYLTADFEFPVETLNFVNANALSGNVFAYYNWGGYVDLRTQGRLKVFIDARAETVYADDTYADYMSVLDQKPGWIDVVERSGADFVLWPRWHTSDVVTSLLRPGRWRPLYRDSVSQLLVRATTTLPAPLVASPESPYRQLSLGVTALRQEQLEAARRHLERALRADPDLQPACTTLVEVQLLGGDVEGGPATAVRCSARYPGSRAGRAAPSDLPALARGGVGIARSPHCAPARAAILAPSCTRCSAAPPSVSSIWRVQRKYRNSG